MSQIQTHEERIRVLEEKLEEMDTTLCSVLMACNVVDLNPAYSFAAALQMAMEELENARDL
jgi:hypothetical protein